MLVTDPVALIVALAVVVTPDIGSEEIGASLIALKPSMSLPFCFYKILLH